jgi:hypothetical protein
MFSRLLKTGLLVAISDAIFASLTGMFIPPIATPARVFRGVASVLLGKSALTGGTTTLLIGLAMHLCVALFWSGIFLIALNQSEALRKAIQTPSGALLIAIVYGITIWLVMTWIVIPSQLHRPPTLSTKYWVQLVGHPLFVVGPMIFAWRTGEKSNSRTA